MAHVWQWDGDDDAAQVIVHTTLILNVDVAVLACTASVYGSVSTRVSSLERER